MLLGFKTELHPNKQQKIMLAKHALCCKQGTPGIEDYG
ncbi:MAG: helix-turn-helix domain-containing protein [Trichodesmium sp. MO_231.B1]|nr:helix-turn-helix domain-containing protein [Trichodesmium sp. MO_231.B1]